MRDKQTLLNKIKKKDSKIAVIGLGYVGLPLAILFAKKGFKVTGFAKTQKKIEDIKNGTTEFLDLNSDIKKMQSAGKFCAEIMSLEKLRENNVFIICLPTPITKEGKPQISALLQTAKYLSRITLDNKFIINESTVAPFMTHKIFGNLGKNYFLACSPERVDPGINNKSVDKISKLVGGIDGDSLELGIALYKSIIKSEVVSVKSMDIAEMSKMLENTYRAVNIALINEFALLSDSLNIDLMQVIDAAKSKWSYHEHYPGIGVGGHCIPIDPYYVLDLATKNNLRLNVIKTSLKMNENMPLYLAKKIKKQYKKGMNVLIYGLTYKKNVPDLRESPVIILCDILKKMNIDIKVYDPLLTKGTIEFLNLNYSDLKPCDIFIVGSDHDQLFSDYKKVIHKNTVVVDGKNFFKKSVGKLLIGVGHTIIS